MKGRFGIAMLILLSGSLYSQQSFMEQKEEELSLQFETLRKASSEREKYAANEALLSGIAAVLQIDSSYYYSFSGLRNLGILNSPDSLFRLVQWNLPHRDGSHDYFAFIQHNPGKTDGGVVRLYDDSENMENPGDSILDAQHWFGCLYYDLMPVRLDSMQYYVLLGTDMNNLFSSKKIIEILSFDEEKEPLFGLPVLWNGDSHHCRRIFEYDSRARMSLKFNAGKERIVYDHLSPADPSYLGQYQYYGPDFSYDAYQLNEGVWVLHEDVDARNW